MKILPVGTHIRATRPIYHPHIKMEYPTGTMFDIVRAGPDAPFGFYHLCLTSLTSKIEREAFTMMFNIVDFEVVV